VTIKFAFKEIKNRLNSGNTCFTQLPVTLSYHLLSKNIKITLHKNLFSLQFYMVVKLGL
jgi:hypothetical protein